MRAGQLRHYCTFITPGETRGAGGNIEYDYLDGAEQSIDAYAEITPVAGREVLEASATQAEITHEVKLRFVTGITSKTRVIHEGRTFEGVSVRNVQERDRELILSCTERGV